MFLSIAIDDGMSGPHLHRTHIPLSQEKETSNSSNNNQNVEKHQKKKPKGGAHIKIQAK